MAKLRKFTLDFNERSERWRLTNDATDQVERTFGRKSQATAGGVLKRTLGAEGGRSRSKKRTVGFRRNERTLENGIRGRRRARIVGGRPGGSARRQPMCPPIGRHRLAGPRNPRPSES